MIVQRITYKVKPGHVEEAVALAREQKARYVGVVPVRFYAPGLSPPYTIAVEFEFENLAALDALWTRMGTDPDWAAFMEKWTALLASGGTNNTWTLVE
jgi:hypothetical protein